MPHHPGDELAWRAYWRGDDGPDGAHDRALARLAFLAGRQSVRDEADATPAPRDWSREEILRREG